jgi:hypothetical protein
MTEPAAPAAAPRALPDPAIDPADVQAILPDLTLEQATLAAQLATVAVSAVLYPTPIPTPTPEPIYAVLLAAATRAGIAILQGSALPVVSESLGSYSYRLATPQSLGGVFGLTDEELGWLEPWTARDTAYDIDVAPWAGPPWPFDWWQSNLEQPDGRGEGWRDGEGWR